MHFRLARPDLTNVIVDPVLYTIIIIHSKLLASKNMIASNRKTHNSQSLESHSIMSQTYSNQLRFSL